jgi:cell division protein FtsZ
LPDNSFLGTVDSDRIQVQDEIRSLTLSHPSGKRTPKIEIVGIGHEGTAAIKSLRSSSSVVFNNSQTDKRKEDDFLIDKNTLFGDIAAADVAFIVFGIDDLNCKALMYTLEAVRKINCLAIAVFNEPMPSGLSEITSFKTHGVKKIKGYVDTVLIVPDYRKNSCPVPDRFRDDGVLGDSIKILTDTLLIPGLVCMDFADFKAIFKKAGFASIGTGIAIGNDRGVKAAENALSSLKQQAIDISNCERVYMNIGASPENLTLEELTDASDVIYDVLNADCTILWRDNLDELAGDILQVTVFPAGIS